MSAKIPPFAGVAARLIVGGVLVYAGATKAAGPAEEFALIIANYDILPREMVLTAATFLPWVELFIGWSLVLGFRLRAAAAAAGALFVSFVFALIAVRAKGIELPNCGCFGDAIHFTPLQALLFDSVMGALSWTAFRAGSGPASLDSWSQRGL